MNRGEWTGPTGRRLSGPKGRHSNSHDRKVVEHNAHKEFVRPEGPIQPGEKPLWPSDMP